MKRLIFVLLTAVLAFSVSLAQAQKDTVNGWYVHRVVGDTAGFAASSKILADSAKEGKYSQSFSFRLKRNTFVEWRKELGIKHLKPSVLRHWLKVRSSSMLKGTPIRCFFYLQHGDTLENTQIGSGSPYLTGIWMDIEREVYSASGLLTYDAIIIRFHFAPEVALGEAEIVLDDLCNVHGAGPPFFLINTIIDRMGDDPQPGFDLSLLYLWFDSVLVGQSKTKSVRLWSSGNDTLKIFSVASTSADFTVGPVASMIPPARSVEVEITFSPKKIGYHDGDIVFDHNAEGTPKKFPVAGVGKNLTDVVLNEPNRPCRFALHQNYPNPFNPTTVIPFEIRESGFTTLRVYDVLSREIATLVSARLAAGRHEALFEARNLPSGVYFYRLETGKFVETRRMILLR